MGQPSAETEAAASPAAAAPTDAAAAAGAASDAPAGGAASGWTEHVSPDGRRYYHHKARGISSWEKPNELKTRAELSAAAAADSNWKEYTAASGARAAATWREAGMGVVGVDGR
jgi:pre-mRNA-processing factor 40